ncbi:hypothetical protein [Thomasclavelia spiroformis]|uniref:hypothetical protein n=1 Tax=Thomasclavelia spiroformis TaxID=29348 RepID=UPI00241C267B|nr:hypothetical protein [Thomasclavelia spiroformis]MBS6114454.1 hypothetical protein [Thomasclavelia spiroformis]
MYEVPLIVNAYGFGSVIGISGISLTFAGVKPKAEVTLLLLNEIVPEDNVILLPTLTPPSTELVAVGKLYEYVQLIVVPLILILVPEVYVVFVSVQGTLTYALPLLNCTA